MVATSTPCPVPGGVRVPSRPNVRPSWSEILLVSGHEGPFSNKFRLGSRRPRLGRLPRLEGGSRSTLRARGQAGDPAGGATKEGVGTNARPESEEGSCQEEVGMKRIAMMLALALAAGVPAAVTTPAPAATFAVAFTGTAHLPTFPCTGSCSGTFSGNATGTPSGAMTATFSYNEPAATCPASGTA